VLEDTESLCFRVLSARYGMEGGRLGGMLPYGGVIFLLCVGRSGLAIMLVAQLVMGGIRFFGRMFGLVGWRLVSGLVGYSNYRWLGRCQCLICVS
jgi:hypothetical protein